LKIVLRWAREESITNRDRFTAAGRVSVAVFSQPSQEEVVHRGPPQNGVPIAPNEGKALQICGIGRDLEPRRTKVAFSPKSK